MLPTSGLLGNKSDFFPSHPKDSMSGFDWLDLISSNEMRGNQY